jgi:TetR/AcrR family transcriptional regulator, cholesterol catabolism regulator
VRATPSSGEIEAARPATARAESVTTEILHRAARLFRISGYENTTLRDISSEVGLSKAGLYHYFASKEEILEGVAERAIEVLLTHLRSVSATSDHPDAKLREFVVGRVRIITEEREVLAVFWQEFPTLRPTLKERLATRLREYRRGVLELLQEGQRAGAIRPDLDLRLVVLALDGMTGWVYLWYRPDGRARPDEIGDAFWQLVWGGLPHDAAASRARPSSGPGKGKSRSRPVTD